MPEYLLAVTVPSLAKVTVAPPAVVYVLPFTTRATASTVFLSSELVALYRSLMIPVSSSNLESVGYENGILCIAFHGGRIYEYTGVPESVYQGLMAASSHGKYFHAYIRNVYPYSRIA